MMVFAPRRRFGIKSTAPETGEFCVFDVSNEYIVDPDDFLSMGKATPFEGRRVYGKCLLTVYDGKPVYVEGVAK